MKTLLLKRLRVFEKFVDEYIFDDLFQTYWPALEKKSTPANAAKALQNEDSLYILSPSNNINVSATDTTEGFVRNKKRTTR